MSIGLATRGYIAQGAGGGALGTPIISNVTPEINAVPGSSGAFSATFRTARVTPIEFDITNIPSGARITISVHYENRNETLVALDFDSSVVDADWVWPFDVEPDNSIGDLLAEPVHVTMLPRGGWPPTTITIKVAACKISVVP